MAELNQLFDAIKNNEDVTELLERLDVETVNGTDIVYGRTPLHVACRNNNNRAVTALLAMEGIQVNVKDRHGNSPLLQACSTNSSDAVAALLAMEGIQVNTKNNYGNTPIMLAASRSHVEALRLMLGDPRVDIDVRKETVGKETVGNEIGSRERKNTCIEMIREERRKRKNRVPRQIFDEESEVKILEMPLDLTLKNNLKENKRKRELEDDSDTSSNLKDARETLECPVCMDPMKPPTRIWMCPASHLVCELCRPRLEGLRCPTCRTEKVKLRAFMAEKFAQAVYKCTKKAKQTDFL